MTCTVVYFKHAYKLLILLTFHCSRQGLGLCGGLEAAGSWSAEEWAVENSVSWWLYH